MTFALATIRHDGRPTPAIEVDERWCAPAHIAPRVLEPSPTRGLINVFEHWTEREPALMTLADDLRRDMLGGPTLAPAPLVDQFLTPLQYPTKVVLMGANYHDHMEKDAPFMTFKAKE